MLFDLIRDFFVMHVFGGTTSTDVLYNPTYGAMWDDYTAIDNSAYLYQIGFTPSGDGAVNPMYMDIGNWLSTTATMISITIIVILCCLFVYKIIKLIGGLIR